MLGTRIAALRRQSGLNQSELAKVLGVSPSAVGMYEQGRREPSGALLVQIAEHFGVTTDYLLTGKLQTVQDAEALSRILRQSLQLAEARLDKRASRPFSRDELTVLLAAMLTEP
jgi:transcriptional regulator with XRE-family HTH domain